MRIDDMIIFAMLFLVIVIILYLPVFFILKKKGNGLLRQLSYLLLLWSFFLIIFVTITPINFSPEHHLLNLRPFAWVDHAGISRNEWRENIGNILMFIPSGFLIPAVFKVRKIHLVFGLVFIMSFSIEFTQYFIGRIADIDDLLQNLLGGVIGYAIFKVFNQLLASKTWWNKFVGLKSEK